MSYKDDVRYIVGPQIKTYLVRHGIPQKDIAKKIEMSRPALSSRLNGFTEVAATELFAICDALGVPADTFRPGKDAKTA